MPLNNEYKRYFIILQEDDKGYEMTAGKIPTGYVKIEIKNGKGKLTAYAQNIKYGDKVDYRVLLIAPIKKAAVDMGRLMVDSNGRGELNVEFDAENVMRSGMAIADFKVAAVSTSTAVPLSGFTGRDKVQWKNSYHIVNKPQERMDIAPTVEEVITPMQTAPMDHHVHTPQTPAAGANIIGEIVEGAKDIVEDVIEGAKDVAGDIIDNVVESAKDIVEEAAEGAKDVAGAVKKGVKDVIEYIVEGDEVKPVQQQPMQHQPMMQHHPIMHHQPIMQPSPVKPKKEPVPIQEVTQPITMQPIAKPKKEPVPIQEVTQPITMQPIVKPKKEPVPIQEVTEPITMQPIEPAPIQMPKTEFIPMPMPEPAPAPAPEPVKPIEKLPKKPLYEAETEIKAKFVIETEEKHVPPKKPKYECEVQCPQIDYKDYYYDEDSERDSDSDSDSDDRDKKKKSSKCDCGHKEKDIHKHSYCESPMYRRLEKILRRLREYEPFDYDDSREKWFKVEDDIYLLNSATIPFMGSLMPLGYPYMSNDCVMMIGRKDYILGVKYQRDSRDKKYIKTVMFGIPGIYDIRAERYYRMRGFAHFKNHRSRNYGYWIMKVDIETGEILMK